MAESPMLQSNLEGRERLKTLLKQFSVRTGQTFKLASGKTSDFYVDVKKTSLHPEGAFWLGRMFCAILANYPQVVAVGGPTLGADPLTSATIVTAWTLGRRVNGFIIRKQAKDYGTGAWVEGPDVVKGSPVVILEDVLTTGGSALQACQRAAEAGMDVRAVFAVIDRQEGGSDALKAAGYDVHAIFQRHELV